MIFRPPKYNPRFPKYFERFVWLLTGLLTFLSLFGFLGGLHWLPDLVAHFRVQYLQAALLLAGICLWVRRNKCAVALIALAALNYLFIFPLYTGKISEAPPAKPVRAMLLNLNAENGNTARVISSITNTHPDLVVLEEVTPKWAFELSQLADLFPHNVMQPQEGPFGIMLLSKYPLSKAAIVEIGSAGLPSITATVHLPQGEISLLATHPLPPIGAIYSAQRNEQLEALPEWIKAHNHPVLLMGDLNLTQWSPHFSRLLKNSGLKDSTNGFGFQPTWPAQSSFIRIPLDHLLHAPEIVIHNRAVGSNVGSDHRPVIVDFSLQAD